jgi:hypothetical protein
MVSIEEKRGDMMDETNAIFKSYLRKLLRDLKDLQNAIQKTDFEKAQSLLVDLIADTQEGIED